MKRDHKANFADSLSLAQLQPLKASLFLGFKNRIPFWLGNKFAFSHRMSRSSRLFLFFSCLVLSFFVSSCGPSQQQGGLRASPAASHQRPSCENSPTAEELGLEKKKQALFDSISQSENYTNDQDREEALSANKKMIANLELRKCPDQIERILQSIASEQ